VSDLDRWADGTGPEPPRLRALLDAARRVPEVTAEEAAFLERAFVARAAAREQDRARDQRRRRAIWMGFALAAALATALALGWKGLGRARERDAARVAPPGAAPSTTGAPPRLRAP
jgi:hypothetical protein